MPATAELDCRNATETASWETRWFGRGHVPGPLLTEISRGPYARENRSDLYLAEADTWPAAPKPDLGVKIRDGSRFEIKYRTQQALLGRVVAEHWRKSSQPLHTAPPSTEWNRPRWIEVDKAIAKVTLCRTDRGWEVCEPGTHVTQGASFECCQVRVANELYWSAAVDRWARGIERDELFDYFDSVVGEHSNWSVGYPAFLASIA